MTSTNTTPGCEPAEGPVQFRVCLVAFLRRFQYRRLSFSFVLIVPETSIARMAARTEQALVVDRL